MNSPNSAGRFLDNVPLGTQQSRGLEQQSVEIPLFRQYLRIALRWKWIVAATVAAFVIAGLILTLMMTPKYTATATIEIARESNKVVNIQGVEQESSSADAEFYQTQYGLLRAQSLAERVATRLRLIEDPSFYETFSIKLAGDRLGTGFGRNVTGAQKAERRRVVADTLLRNLTVKPIRLSRLVELSFTSPDPELSAKIVNAWTSNFITSNLERRFDATSYARQFLESRLNQLRIRLGESERELVAYASRQRIINLPAATVGNGVAAERSIVADNLASLNAELAGATAERVKAQARLGRGAGAPPEALQNDAVTGLRQRRAELSADYNKLLVQFEPQYPTALALKSQIDQLDDEIRREEDRIGGSIRRSFNESVVRENALATRVRRLEAGLLDFRRRSIQYNIFQRDVDTNRELYNGLLQRYKEIGVAGGIGVNNISSVDPAEVPNRPSSPRMLLNLFISTILGLGAGLGLALLLEQSDESIADPTEVEKAIGVPLLGTVPKVHGQTPGEALLDRRSELVDAYHSVHATLRFATDRGAPRLLAVTSTRPSEGKSTTSLALATLLARNAKSVLLIDGDMRAPSTHRVVKIANSEGLADALAGQDDLARLIAHVETFGVDVMPAGPLPPNAAELLASDRFSRILMRLGETYDHIVIDSPPVMGLADALLIGSRVEGVIYAIESHGIRSSLAKVALGRLSKANIRVIGAVLTKFEPKRAHFGYGYEYGYSYGRTDKSPASA